MGPDTTSSSLARDKDINSIGSKFGFSSNYATEETTKNINKRDYSNNERSREFSTKNIFQNRLADATIKYGTNLIGYKVDTRMKNVPSYGELKCFFAVDTNYVAGKIHMLLFPYRINNWSGLNDPGARPEPKEDCKSPDLYIPLMSYLTYILIAGLILGANKSFTPELLSIIASQALAWTLMEITLQKLTIYFMNSVVNLTILDLLAYSGYKFVGVIICLAFRVMFGTVGYIVSFLYSGSSISYYIVKSLKWRLVSEVQSVSFSDTGYTIKKYFLFLTGVSQFIQIWWLSRCLEPSIA